MKKITLFSSALIFMMFATCTEKKNQETIDFILSQQRDSDLVGWSNYPMLDRVTTQRWIVTLSNIRWSDTPTLV
jgi:hypothetical protein